MPIIKYQLAPASVKLSSNVPYVLLSLLIIVSRYFVLTDCSTDLFRTCKSLIATFEIFSKSSRSDPFEMHTHFRVLKWFYHERSVRL